MSWYQSLPAAESSVPCGGGAHAVRWEGGRLTLPAHPDAEAELVLGALGGDKPACVSLAETWERHADDITVLTAGPRSAADRITITWEQVQEQREHWSAAPGGRVIGSAGSYAAPRIARPFTGAAPPTGTAPAGAAPAGTAPLPPGSARSLARMAVSRAMGRAGMTGRAGEEFARRMKQGLAILELLALGPEFQFRLSGAVAAAWADGRRAGERAERRPELTAALTGRFAPVAAEWLGIDPDAVMITPHEGPGWGTLSLTGSGEGRRLTGALPVGWLADVWACGLALADGHLVVGVTEPGYPHTRVLGLPEPGAAPVPLEVNR